MIQIGKKRSAVEVRTGGMLFGITLLILAAFQPLAALIVFAIYLAIRAATR